MNRKDEKIGKDRDCFPAFPVSLFKPQHVPAKLWPIKALDEAQ